MMPVIDDITSGTLGVRHIIGHVPQNVRLYGTMTAKEVLTLFRRPFGIKDVAACVGETLYSLDSAYLADQPVGPFRKGCSSASCRRRRF